MYSKYDMNTLNAFPVRREQSNTRAISTCSCCYKIACCAGCLSISIVPRWRDTNIPVRTRSVVAVPSSSLLTLSENQERGRLLLTKRKRETFPSTTPYLVTPVVCSSYPWPISLNISCCCSGFSLSLLSLLSKDRFVLFVRRCWC